MEFHFNHEKDQIIAKLVDVIESKLPKEKALQLSNFVKKFYTTVSADDLQQHSIMDLYGATLSFWDFITERQPDETKVRVYNPHFESNAWQSTHTIIEIITGDIPFLVDSILMELNRRGLATHFIVHIGGLRVCRDENHRIVDIFGHSEDGGTTCREEAPIFIEIDRQTDPEVLDDIHDSITKILNDVRCANDDWGSMRERVKDAINELIAIKEHLDPEEFAESIDFLKWIEDHHFTFLGIRDYELITEGKEKVLKLIPNTGLGVLRDASTSKVSRRIADMTPEARRLTLSSQVLIISKTNTLSTVHRPIYTDYIGIKRFDKKGNIIGERRIIGLYTSAAYNTNPRQIPFLRRKVENVLKASNLKPKSHAGKVLLNILETLPRDDLFQGTTAELLEISMGIYYLQERKLIRLFARKDIYGRFVSCLVFVPRDHFNTQLRQAMQRLLEKEFDATESSFFTRFSDSVLARIHFIIRTDPAKQLTYDLKAIEQKLIEIGRSWDDDLRDALLDYYGEEQGNQLLMRYNEAFSVSYKEFYPSRTALYDIKHIENLSDDNQLELNFFKPLDQSGGKIRLKVYQYHDTIPLSDVLPILENMGLRVISERPHQVAFADGRTVWINDFGMTLVDDNEIDIDAIKETFQEAFTRIWTSEVENDGFNQLVLKAGLGWRETSVLRAYAKYFRQTGFTFSQHYIEQSLAAHPHIASDLVKFFLLRFDPKTAAKNAEKIATITETLKANLDQVVSLDDDRILRRYYDLILATLRTNYFQTDANGGFKSYLSFKLNPAQIPDLPLPRPMFEIFVYSARFEGVHLRGGRVARGGLRWSDRREDFRTEILGLMKAQQVKNAVIVPSGAKGGFVPKHLPVDGTREEIMAEGIACYQNFIRGLLDITDNLKGAEVIKPDNVFCYDEDDTYLVVAADKGTATFSDIANAISQEYGFWLDDAFASGGSVGYDHKKMGITARGAWESVKRHFRELDINTQTTDFTCIGIGDMAGDVFGNGMLLSRHIKLVGAFNHIHIFVDPDPDPETSYIERERLFNLPRSAWTDYNEKLISKGGGVFSRSAKSIAITPEMKKVFAIDHDILVPSDLISAMLKAPVDLLWNGGIGTYVKGIHETHNDVGDRANDALRINSDQLRARVVGEGGNLGFTQQARVECALGGTKIYTDFIDNSAGVDCSDHEVNIKILLNAVVANGDMTIKQRNELLASMTEEVAQLVLSHNYHQTMAISIAAGEALKHVDLHSRYIDVLEKSGKLDRTLEFLPDHAALVERKLANKGMARPGIAVLLAYSKIIMKENILESDLPEDPFLSRFLLKAFPEPLQKKYKNEMQQHSLRREIIATQLSNRLINEMGFTFVYRLHDETGAPTSAIVRAYTVASSIFNLPAIWAEVEALDNQVPAKVQYEMLLTLYRLLRRATRWILKNRRTHYDIQTVIDELLPGVDALSGLLPGVFLGEDLSHFNRITNVLLEHGVPESLAKAMAAKPTMLAALDINEAAKEQNCDIAEVAEVYFAIDEHLELGWVRDRITNHRATNHWEVLTREALRDDLDWQQRLLTTSILSHETNAVDLDKRIKSWIKKYSSLVERWKYMLADLQSSSDLTFTMFFVAIRELLDLTQTSIQQTTLQNEKTKKAKVNSKVVKAPTKRQANKKAN